jgi:rubredoxin
MQRGDVTLMQAFSVQFECIDCGRSRWRKPGELYKLGFKPGTTINELADRFHCPVCREEGLSGKRFAINVAFVHDWDRIRAEAAPFNIPKVRASG